MKQKLFWLQAAALGVVLVSLAGIGVLIFSRHGLDNLVPLCIFAGLGIAGFAANAVLAVARVLWERNNRK